MLAAYQVPSHYDEKGNEIRQPGRIVLLNTDGSDFRVLLDAQQPAVSPFSYAVGMHPTWAPSGNELAYVNGERLSVVDLSGTTREVFSGGEPVQEEFTSQYGPDGEWIYFTRGTYGSQHTFWRVRRDGTGAEQVSPAASWGVEVMPSPDPAGDRVAFQTNRATNAGFAIRTLRLSTGVVSKIDVLGSYPHWSPTGEWIGYLDNDQYEPFLRLMAPDGSQQRLVGSGVGAHPALSWSPDGLWIAISGNLPTPGKVGLSLVNVETGVVLPLSFHGTLVQPSWRP